MLKQLKISNYALIDSLDISFNQGLTIITGETGAGKSIMMGALSLILGGKADTKVIRNLEKKSVIEAIFDIDEYGLRQFFEDNDIEYFGDECILRREIAPNGRTRAFINDTPVTLPIMKALSMNLIDIHSQHGNMLLADSKYQLGVIDNLHGDAALISEYRERYADYKEVSARIKSLRESKERQESEEDYIRFQLAQLKELNLIPGEDAELEAEERKLSNVNEIKSNLWQCEELMSGDGGSSMLSSLSVLSHNMSRLCEIYDGVEDIAERIEAMFIEAKDVARTISALQNDIVDDPAELDRVRDRLNAIYSLETKHKVRTVDELVAIRDDYEAKLNVLDNFDEEITRLERELKDKEKIVTAIAGKLSTRRKEAAAAFETALINLAMPLGMKNLRFHVHFDETPLSATGIDNVHFLFAFNKQQSLMPVEDSASGGEISRVMLCIKSIIAQKMKLPTIIFDEVDTGVSGDIANRMGELMRSISCNIQVITITHLPQVAAKGNNHLKVYKRDTADATFTSVRVLDENERIQEIAGMLSGDKVSEAAINNAKILLASNK